MRIRFYFYMNTLDKLQKDPLYRKRIEERARIIQTIRDFFVARGFLETQTPSLTAHPGMEPYLNPFETRVLRDSQQLGANSQREVEVGLITSPEYSLKKLLGAGFDKIFELARVYRNGEPQGGYHNSEFTMLEWYRSDADYNDIMNDVDELLSKLSENTLGKAERIKVRDIFLEKAGIDLDVALDAPALIKKGKEAGFQMKNGERFDDAFFRIFLLAVEPALKDYKNPVILYEYPIELAALAKQAANQRYAERFELYIKGIEIANAFSELTDTVEQRRRFEEEAALRQAAGKKVYPIDEELLAALPAIGRAGGIALGVDRLVMVLLGAVKLEDVMLFPSSELFDNK